MNLISWILSPIVNKRLSAFQNELIEKHLVEVENIYRQMRGWRHDYHNHIQTLKALVHLNQYDNVNEYLDKLDGDLVSVDTVLKTGNIMVDAILNSKISLAFSNKITVTAKATVPNKLLVSEIDLCVIIGNLIDNATESCLKINDINQRFIRVYIGTLKGQLYISVTNSSGGDVKKLGKIYFTTKEQSGHGFGLMRIDKIADKYSGYVNRQNEDGVFATEVMLPL